MGNEINDSASAYKYLEKSPMFKFSLSSKELFHSNFLEWLSNVDSDAFMKLIITMAGLGSDFVWPSVWRVKREYNNFDLCIVAYDQAKYQNNEDERIDDDEDFRIMFVIENKVKSIPYEEQLLRYSQEAESINDNFWKKRGEEELCTKNKADNEDEDPDYDWIGVVEGKWTLRKKTGKRKNTKWSIIKTFEDLKDSLDRKDNKTNFKKCYAKYYASINPIKYILLSLANTFPGSNDIKEKVWVIKDKDKKGKVPESYNWKVCNYCDYKNNIEKYYNISLKELNSQIIADYCNFIKSLTLLSKTWEGQYKDDNKFLHFEWVKKDKDKNKYVRSNFMEEYEKARTFRIHDLYQKLKYSYLCTVLYNNVKELGCVKVKTKEIDVFPTNQGGLFKKDDKKGSDYICVNYTYLHGEPLLEINIHPKCNDNNCYEIDYVIQVQGGVYEHGFGVKKNGESEKVTAAEVWEVLKRTDGVKKFPNAETWMRLSNQEDAATAWFKDKNAEGILEKEILPKRKSRDENKLQGNGTGLEYNKYDMKGTGTTYIYQSRRINNGATIGNIMDLMIKDVKKVIDFILKS